MTVSAPRAEGAAPALDQRVRDVRGMRRLGLAAASGALAAAALPPIYAVPALAVSFPLLMWMIEGCVRRRDAFAVGWAFGFGYFVAGLYWIAIALLVDANQFAWLIPFAVGGISAYLALYAGLSALAVAALRLRGFGAIFVFAAAWTLGEWLRGIVLTGFPWNPLGSVWAFSDTMLQPAAFAGVYGLTLLTVIAATLPAMSIGPRGIRWTPLAASVLVLALVATGGMLRLSGSYTTDVPDVRLRLVQPNIQQADKWKPDLRPEHVRQQMEMSLEPSSGPAPTDIIWSETATPYDLSNDERLRSALARAVPAGGLLITGALRTSAARGADRQVWNSLQALDDTGRVAGSFDKFHLVPFGEYVPLRWLLGFSKITAGRGDFTPGNGPETLDFPGLPPVSPLICYEIVFPDQAVADGVRPGWILNVTNDAWFGISSGPYQHFAAARLRAVEQGLPVVRVANTGISAVIDPFGRVTARLDLGTRGVLDAALPRPASQKTVFATLGQLPVMSAIVGLIAAGLFFRRRIGLR